MGKPIDKMFINLVGIAKSAGKVTSAHLYGNGFILIEGVRDDGESFSISMSSAGPAENNEK